MVVGAWYARALPVFGVLVAVLPSLWMWGFTVDDALISLRYAHHVASGAGYRFNALGPSTDGVTPLPWPLLVVLAAREVDLLRALSWLEGFGIAAWTVAGAVLGRALAKRAHGDRRATLFAFVALAVVGLAFPFGAWAASGMETGLAMAFATIAAASFARPLLAAGLAGLATTLRPELVPWALVIALGAVLADAVRRGRTVATRARRLAIALVLALGPFAVCTVVRLVVFGRPAPLALLAKPSDFAHGATYAAAATLVVLTPILSFCPLAIFRSSPLSKTLVLAACVHVIVVVAVGGDWMPYARLVVPVAPSLALAFVDLAPALHLASAAIRTVAALALGTLMLVRAAPAGRHVDPDRRELVARARPAFASTKVVAALDVGWVGAATDATIVDLAGLTDAAIAVLPGGHTSKAVDVGMLLDRGVDTVVVFAEPRIVERRLVASSLFQERFALATTLPFGARGQSYRVYRRR